jgi:2-dehydropantoate 2-reductase
MKIAVLGCGALGSFYGARLCRAGQAVHFLLRSDYAVVARQGVQIQSVDGDFQVHPQVARRPEEIGPCELVLIALKTTANDCLAQLAPPLTDARTLVMTLQNGLGNEERLAQLLGPQNILGGLCFVCLNRLRPGLICHSAHGRILMGEFQRTALPRTRQIATLFRQAGICCEVTDDLACAHWEKLVWNVPFNGLGVAGAAGYEAVVNGALAPGARLGRCLSTDALLGDPRWLALVEELMREIIAAANRLGHPIPPACAAENLARTRNMGAYYASTLIDFERGLPLETESLFLEPLRQAQTAGVSTPRLAALCRLLAQLEGR